MTSEIQASRADLGARLGAPWSDDAGALGHLVRNALTRSVEQIARHDPGVRSGLDPEDVHQFRVGIRRLRSDLRTFAPLFKQHLLRDLAHELRWLNSTVGPVRDGDVLAHRLAHDIETLRRVGNDDAARLVSRLAHQNHVAQSMMRENLETERYDVLRDELRAIADQPPVRSKRVLLVARPASEIAAAFVEAPWHSLEQRARGLGPSPTDAALHELRILVKRTRYAAEAVSPAVVEAAGFAAALAGVQTALGDHHDSVVAEAWLSGAVRDSAGASRLAGNLIFRQRSHRARSRAKWLAAWERASAPELRAWLPTVKATAGA